MIYFRHFKILYIIIGLNFILGIINLCLLVLDQNLLSIITTIFIFSGIIFMLLTIRKKIKELIWGKLTGEKYD